MVIGRPFFQDDSAAAASASFSFSFGSDAAAVAAPSGERAVLSSVCRAAAGEANGACHGRVLV
jgi:hypothetical protein